MVDHWVLIPKAGVWFPLFQIIIYILDEEFLSHTGHYLACELGIFLYELGGRQVEGFAFKEDHGAIFNYAYIKLLAEAASFLIFFFNEWLMPIQNSLPTEFINTLWIQIVRKFESAFIAQLQESR